MGPITLFDKSFLQSLGVDESVWFDNFFLPTVSPLFFVETLADLAKPPRSGMTAEEEVARIADKFPEMHGTPCALHQEMITGDLMGNPVPMNGQIPVAGGRPVRSPAGETGVVFDQPAEARAFSRWIRGEFHRLEREFARDWRQALTALDVDEVSRLLGHANLNASECRTLEDVRKMTLSLTSDRVPASDSLGLSLTFLGADAALRSAVYRRHHSLGFPRFSAFAPYAAFVLNVEVFFQLAATAHLIDSKPSSRIDIAYLYYLPFCMLFVSSDRLHERCARFFLRDDQKFLWGPDLKDGLQHLNQHYMDLPEETKIEGVLKFAHWPPEDSSFLVTRIFDEHLPHWRERAAEAQAESMDPEAQKRLIEQMRRMTDAPGIPAEDAADFDAEESSFLSVQRMVRRKKGAWYQVPRDTED